MSFDKNKEMLSEMLEKILFDEMKLYDLKEMIIELNNGTLTAREFKEKIFLRRKEIFQELLDFFPFYMEHLLKLKAIDEFASEIPKNTSVKELKERDDLLIEIFSRLTQIQQKLKTN